MFAVVACAVAIPAGPPQPRPVNAEARRDLAESEKLQPGADEQDLKASSSYGYGYYGGYGAGYGSGYGGYGGYGGGYGNGLSGYYGALGYHPYSYSYGKHSLLY